MGSASVGRVRGVRVVRGFGGAVILGALVLASASACGKTDNVSSGPPGSAAIGLGQGGAGSGALDAQNAEVIAALSPEEKACVEQAADAAAAVESCTRKGALAKQVAGIMARSDVFKGMRPAERAMIEDCLKTAFTGLPAGSLASLAAQEPAAVEAFQKALDTCDREAAPSTTSSLSTGATAPSATRTSTIPAPGTTGAATNGSTRPDLSTSTSRAPTTTAAAAN